jgi:hypothetical protein
LNRTTRCSLLLAAVSWASLAACSDSGDPVAPLNEDPPDPTGVSLAADVQLIFNASCALSGCPAGPGPRAGMSLAAGEAFANIVDVTSTGYAPAKRVVPGDPAASVLYNKIADTGVFGSDMPPGPAALGAGQIEAIRTWIEEGAENN